MTTIPASYASVPELKKHPDASSTFGTSRSSHLTDYRFVAAPPPYRSHSTILEDDNSSALWSEVSGSSSSNSGMGKRRNSWTNLLESQDHKQKRSVNHSPLVASTTASAQSFVPTPYAQGGIPAGIPYVKGSSMTSGASSGRHSASRQNSNASNSVVSDFFLASKGSHMRLNQSGPAGPLPPLPAGQHPASPPPRKKNRMESLRKCWAKPLSKVFCAATCILLIAGIVIATIAAQYYLLPRRLNFSWLAPEMLRGGQQNPNNIRMQVRDDQVRFDLTGSPPFKNNYISVLDFKTNKVAIVDSSLKSGDGRNLVCFVMDLNRQSISDISSLQNAAKNSVDKKMQTQGWQDTWNFVPTPITAPQRLFRPEISECRGARWIELSYVSGNQKHLKCSDCFDFCIPEYGIEHDYIRDESYLNIVRRDCFYLFVPEWRNFAGYTNQQNQQDFENYYRGATGGAGISGGMAAIGNTLGNVAGQIGSTLGNVAENVRNNPTVQQLGQQVESKWIAVQQVPQQIANFSQATLSNLRTNLNNWDPRQQQQPQQFPGQQHQQFNFMNPSMQRNDPNGFAAVGQQPPPQMGNYPNDPRLSGFRGPSDAFQVPQQRPMGVGGPVPQNFQGQAVQQQQLTSNDGWNGLSVLHQTPQSADGGMRQNPGMIASGFSPNNPNMPQQAPMNVQQQQQLPPQQNVGTDLSFQNQRQDGQQQPAWVGG